MPTGGYPYHFERREDPITGRAISEPCWNGLHEDHESEESLHPRCAEVLCQCGCHEYDPLPREEDEAEEADDADATEV